MDTPVGGALAPLKTHGLPEGSRLAPATPMQRELPDGLIHTVMNHMGITRDQVKRDYDLLSLGELRFVAHRERRPSMDATKVIPAESVAREVEDAIHMGPEARAVHAWEAGLLMAEYIREHGRPILSGRTIIEVGAGVGLTGFSAAEVATNATVCLTDGDDTAVSLLHTNKELNAGWFGPDADKVVHVRTMKWADVQEVEDTVRAYGPFSAVLGADVVYTVHAGEALAKLLPMLLAGAPRSDASPKPLILLAHEVRHRHEAGGDSLGRDEALTAFLTALCLPEEEGGHPGRGTHAWELTAQRLVKEGDSAYNATEPAKPDAAKISGNIGGGAVAREGASSKPNLTVAAHVRALPLPTPALHGPVGDNSALAVAKDLIEQAVTQHHGAFLLLTLTPTA